MLRVFLKTGDSSVRQLWLALASATTGVVLKILDALTPLLPLFGGGVVQPGLQPRNGLRGKPQGVGGEIRDAFPPLLRPERLPVGRILPELLARLFRPGLLLGGQSV